MRRLARSPRDTRSPPRPPPQHRLDGRVVEVKRAVPREESSRERTSFATRLDPRKVFVGGLAASVTEADFRAYFERFGKVSDAIVMVDRETNR